MGTGGITQTQPVWEQQRLLRPIAADVLRVLAVGMVGAFHFWQQSWVGWGRWEFLQRAGGAWVDAMILLSAFCLYLPHATAWAEGKPFEGCPGLWRRRVVRLLPSYYGAVLLCTLYTALHQGWSRALMVDLAAHLLLVPTLLRQSYVYCPTNGALWTVGVLVMFYLLFPLMVRAFYARPLATLAGLCGAQWLYAGVWVLPLEGVDYSMRFNQLPCMLGVLGLGFAAAQGVAVLGRRLPAFTRPGCTLLGVLGLAGAVWVFRQIASWQDGPHGQLVWRLPLAACFGLALVGLSLGVRIPGGRLWAWLGGISYNFYLWHQWLAVRLKYDWRIPAWQGDTPPNQLGQQEWMHRYLVIVWLAGLAAAVLFTYALERPAARWLNRNRRPQGQNLPPKACKQPANMV